VSAAALDYRFFKLHAGDLAFLVDFIVRRRSGEAEVRVSLWVRGAGRVVRSRDTRWSARDDEVVVGDCVLTASGSRGSVDDVEWDLRFDPGPTVVAPRVPLLSRAGAFDLTLTSRPRSTFDGRVGVGGERFPVAGVTGALTRYQGRRLPDRWHWISADAFAGTDLAVEAVVMRTRLWGVPPALPAGYLWTGEGGRERLVVSPLTGLIQVTGIAADYVLTARGPGGTVRLRCIGDRALYNDLGEGIAQTLLGRCTRGSDGATDDHAGLEHRGSGPA
jgi:hypothetical protein